MGYTKRAPQEHIRVFDILDPRVIYGNTRVFRIATNRHGFLHACNRLIRYYPGAHINLKSVWMWNQDLASSCAANGSITLRPSATVTRFVLV